MRFDSMCLGVPYHTDRLQSKDFQISSTLKQNLRRNVVVEGVKLQLIVIRGLYALTCQWTVGILSLMQYKVIPTLPVAAGCLT